MSGRDLLHKPQVPTPVQDDGEEETTDVKRPRCRDLGERRDMVPARVNAPGAGEAARSAARPAAHKAAYFNQDTSGISEVNQNTSGARALRGSHGATDLRSVVLPEARLGIEYPDPAVLGAAAELMGLETLSQTCLENLVTRQSAFAHGPRVTRETLMGRMVELEALVEARRRALQRMGRAQTSRSAIGRAKGVVEKGLDPDVDLAAEGASLIQGAQEEASGMHWRLAKVLGLKIEG